MFTGNDFFNQLHFHPCLRVLRESHQIWFCRFAREVQDDVLKIWRNSYRYFAWFSAHVLHMTQFFLIMMIQITNMCGQISWSELGIIWKCESIEFTFRESFRCIFWSRSRIWWEGRHSIFQTRNSLVWAKFQLFFTLSKYLFFYYCYIRSILQDWKACQSIVV